MGTLRVHMAIGDVGGEKFEEVEALVDTGATTTVVPGSALRRLGISPTKRETFEYAGGERVEGEGGAGCARLSSGEAAGGVEEMRDQRCA